VQRKGLKRQLGRIKKEEKRRISVHYSQIKRSPVPTVVCAVCLRISSKVVQLWVWGAAGNAGSPTAAPKSISPSTKHEMSIKLKNNI